MHKKFHRGICTICHVSIKWRYTSTHNSGKINVDDHTYFLAPYLRLYQIVNQFSSNIKIAKYKLSQKKSSTIFHKHFWMGERSKTLIKSKRPCMFFGTSNPWRIKFVWLDAERTSLRAIQKNIFFLDPRPSKFNN